MCKRHWKQVHCPEEEHPAVDLTVKPPPPEGESVYDNILPSSISFRPVIIKPKGANEDEFRMPLVRFLKENNTREAGWHRNQERRARGMFPVSSVMSVVSVSCMSCIGVMNVMCHTQKYLCQVRKLIQ